MAYQILNHLGEIVNESISQEEFDSMVETNPNLAFFQYDAQPENDLVAKWKVAESEGEQISHMRIYKKLEE